MSTQSYTVQSKAPWGLSSLYTYHTCAHFHALSMFQEVCVGKIQVSCHVLYLVLVLLQILRGVSTNKQMGQIIGPSGRSQGQEAHATTRTLAWPLHTPLSGLEEVSPSPRPQPIYILPHDNWLLECPFS